MIKNKNWKKIRLFLIITASLNSLLGIFFIFFIGRIVQVAYEGNYYKLLLWIIISVVLFLAKIILNFVEKWILSYWIPNYYHKTRMLILENLFKLMPKKKFKHGQINNAIQNDLVNTTNLSKASIYSLSYGITTLILTMTLLIWMHWILALTTILLIIILLLFPLLVKKKLEKLNLESSENFEKYYSESELQNKNKFQYFLTRRLGDYHQSMLEKIDKFGKVKAKISLKLNIIWQITYFIAEVFFIIPIVLGAMLFGEQNVNVGAIAILVLLSDKILSIGDDLSDGISSFFAFKKIRAKYKMHHVEKIKTIKYENVIAMSSNKVLIKDAVSFSIKSSKNYLFKGRNGSGKSSTLNIIDTPITYSGLIKINGKYVDNLEKYYLSRPHPTSFMFESLEDLERNINVGDIHVYKEIKLLASNELDFKKINNKFSQGETQILSLLHSLSSKPDLLILDESLSSVSKKLKENVYKILLKTKMALIVIDHSLPKRWDEVFDEIIFF